MVNMGVIKKLFFKPSVNKIYIYIILIIFLISLFLPVIHSFQINTIQLPNKQSFLNIELITGRKNSRSFSISNFGIFFVA